MTAQTAEVARQDNTQNTNSLKWSLFATLLYGFCSGSMNFLNKFILSVWSFHKPASIMFAQTVFLALGLHLLKVSGKINLADYSREKAKILIPLTFIYSINSVISLSALTGMNIPMYNAIRRCIPIASLLLGFCMLKEQKININITVSILVITAGTFVAAIGDLDFEFNAYFYGVVSVLSQAVYLITLQRMEMDNSFGALSISYLNCINSTPVMFFMVLITGEAKSVMAYEHWNKPAFLVSFTVLILYGCLFTFSMFLCTTVNSALTTSLVGVGKSAVTTIVGMYAFGGVEATTMMVVGQTVNLAGGAFYAYEKYKLNVAKKMKTLQMTSPPSLNSLELGHDLKSDSDLLKLAPLNPRILEVNTGAQDAHSDRTQAYAMNGHSVVYFNKNQVINIKPRT